MALSAPALVTLSAHSPSSPLRRPLLLHASGDPSLPDPSACSRLLSPALPLLLLLGPIRREEQGAVTARYEPSVLGPTGTEAPSRVRSSWERTEAEVEEEAAEEEEMEGETEEGAYC